MTYPPLPDAPACWSWELPPMPQPSHRSVVERWQAGRCAVCGVVPPKRQLRNYETPTWVSALEEDHDHGPGGDTRGFLCRRCNSTEGQRNAHPVFALYRERPPTMMLGVLIRYGCWEHPAIRNAGLSWENALSMLEEREREAKAHQDRLELAKQMRIAGYDWPDPIPGPDQMTPLMLAAQMVGLTQAEWWETERVRRWQSEGYVAS